MICEKLLPSMYLIEVLGDAVTTIIPGDNGIDRIVFASETYTNDIEAREKLDKVLTFLKGDVEGWDEKVALNPEFFPSMPALVLSEEQEQHQQEIESYIEQASMKSERQVGIPVSQFFDSVGDFVISRSTVSTGESTIVGRVAVMPTFYSSEKSFLYEDQKSPYYKSPIVNHTRLH